MLAPFVKLVCEYIYRIEVFQVQRPTDNVLEKKWASIIPIWNIRFKQANVKFFKKRKEKKEIVVKYVSQIFFFFCVIFERKQVKFF